MFQLLVTVLTIIIITVHGQFTEKDFNNKLHAIRLLVTDRSLIGQWRLNQDNNFVINQKINMINEEPSQIRHSADKHNFFEAQNSNRFVEGFLESQNSKSQATSLYLELRDQKDLLQIKTVVLHINLTDMIGALRSDKNFTIYAENKTTFATCILMESNQTIAKISFAVKLEIFTNVKQGDTITNTSLIFVRLQSNTFNFYAELHPITNQYNRFVMCVGIFTILFLLFVILYKPKQLKQLVYNISQWMIIQISIFVIAANAYLFIVAMSKLDTNMWMVAVCACVNVLVTFLFLRNYEEVIINSFRIFGRQRNEQDNRNNYNHAIGILRRIGLFVFIVTYFIIFYNYCDQPNLWIYQAFLLFALQIHYAYQTGGRGGLSIKLVATIIFTRIPFFYYQFYCPQLTKATFNPKTFTIFIGEHVLLLTFILIQRYFGSRFMIPKQLLPDFYKFEKKFSLNQEFMLEECPICYAKLKQESNTHEQNQQNHKSQEEAQHNEVQLGQVSHQSTVHHETSSNTTTQPQHQVISINSDINIANQKIIMVPPCGHKFHPSCLNDWMDKRMTCPICRSVLPPRKEQRDNSYCC